MYCILTFRDMWSYNGKKIKEKLTYKFFFQLWVKINSFSQPNRRRKAVPKFNTLISKSQVASVFKIKAWNS